MSITINYSAILISIKISSVEIQTVKFNNSCKDCLK